MHFSALSGLALFLAASSVSAQYFDDLVARDADTSGSYLSARDAYAYPEKETLHSLYARSAFADPDEDSLDAFLYARDLYARAAYDEDSFLFARDAYPYDPSKPAGRNNRPAFAPGTFAADRAAHDANVRQHGPTAVEEQRGHLPEKYKPHRPGTPNPNTGSFFRKEDGDAAGRGPGARYRRDVMV